MHSNRKFWKTVTVKQLSMDIIQIVLTLIRATRKTTLNCMPALSVCLVPNAHCKRSQQLCTICTRVTDYTHKFVWYTSQMQRTSRTKWFSVSQPLVLCLRNTFDTTIRQTIKMNYRLQQLELCFELQIEWCLLITSNSIYWNNSSMHWNEIFNLLRC